MPMAVPTMPDSASGRVDHPVLPEVLLQTLGDPEDSAQLADVLAGMSTTFGSVLESACAGPAFSAFAMVSFGHDQRPSCRRTLEFRTLEAGSR